MNKQIIRTEDGYALSVSCFRPKERARGAVLIVAAIGVPRVFYTHLGSWLAENGFLSMTFDFRGTGESLNDDIRKIDCDLITWARDAGSALDHLAEEAPGLPITWIGHSLGGQILPLVPGHQQIARVLTIATGSGYWLENSFQLRWRVGVLWFVMAPLLMSIFGYFPGRRLKMVGDLPLGVMQQWRRWCLNPEYVVGAEGEAMRKQFASFRIPIVSISFTDDEMMSARNTESLHNFYSGAPREMIRIVPREYGLKRIGHFGFFRQSMKDVLWSKLLLPRLIAVDPVKDCAPCRTKSIFAV